MRILLYPTSCLILLQISIFSVPVKADQVCTSGTTCDLTCNNATASGQPTFCKQECTENCRTMECSSSFKECSQICKNNCTAIICSGDACQQECQGNCSMTTCNVKSRCTSNCIDCDKMSCSAKQCFMHAEGENVEVICSASATCELSCNGNCTFKIRNSSARIIISSCSNGKCLVSCPKDDTNCQCGGTANCEIMTGVTPTTSPNTTATPDPSDAVKLKSISISLIIAVTGIALFYVTTIA